MTAVALFPNASVAPPDSSNLVREPSSRPPPSHVRSSRLIGRDLEIAAIERLLELGIRMVTLVGAPGIGKSAIAKAIAERATHANPARRLQRIALGAARDDEHALEIVEQFITNTAPHLVVLDDVENVLHTATSVARAILDADPRTFVIVTSRVALGVDGEHAFEVGPLGLTRDAEGGPSAAAAMVLAGAAAWRPLEDWGRDQCEAIERLVASVDGVPLALETIAARLRTLDVANVITAFARPELVLSSIEPSLPTRHGSMAGALASSWSALSDDERSDLLSAATFASSFRLEDAEAIFEPCATPTLSRLLELRDRHLLQVSTGGDGSLTFAMFAVTRAFVRSRAGEIASAQATRARHDARFLQLTVGASLAFVYTLEGSPLSAAFEDVAEAVDRLIERCDLRDASSLALLAAALPGVAALALEATTAPRAMARFERAAPLVTMAAPDARSAFWLAWGTLHRIVGEPTEAEKCFDAARESAESAELRLIADISRAAVLIRTGRSREADAALARALSGKETPVRAEALRLLAAARAVDGRPQEAELLAREAFRSHVSLEQTPRPAFVILLCALLAENGRFAEARANLESARAGFAAQGRSRWVALCETNLGSIALDEGRVEVAIEHYTSAYPTDSRPDPGDTFEASLAAGYGGAACLLADQPARASELLERAAHLSERSSAPDRGRFFRALLAVAVAHAHHRNAATAERAYVLLGRVQDSVEQSILRDAVNVLLASKEDKPLALRRAGATMARTSSLPGSSFVRRIAMRVLEATVRAESRRDGRVLRLASDGSWFETSSGRVDLSTRLSLRRLLLALASSAQTSPGALLTAPELIGAGWPGERILPTAARGRLRVAMCTLRKLGLREFLASSRHGHTLESQVELVEVAATVEEPTLQTA